MSSTVTNQPKSKIELQEEKLGKHWAALSNALYTSYDQGINARQGLDRDLTIYNNAYEMRTTPRNWPWKNASNVTTTIIPTQVDTTLADIVLAVYAIQRFYVINGNTEIAASNQHDVEQFLNAELFRQRPGAQPWLMQHIESTFASLRDGTGVTEILYRKEFADLNVAIVQRLRDPDTGIDILDPTTQKPIIRTTTEKQRVPIYDDVQLETVELRNFGVIPAWQTNIDKAAAVWRRVYLDSTELHAMCKSKDNPDGPLNRDAVDYALSFLAPGESELKYSRQGYSTYSIAGQIDVALEEGTAVPELQQHTGPLEIIRFHSKQFFNGQEYVFWLHPHTQTCLGYQKYQYWHNQRPFSLKRPLPRIDRVYAISLVERILPTVIEIQGNRNRRNDFLDQRTLPPMYEMDGAKLLTKNNSYGPDARWKVPAGQANAVGIIPMPQEVSVLLAGKEEEMLMRQDIQEFTGNSDPMLGTPTSGRPTAKGIQAAVARAGMRHNFMSMYVRDADARTLYQIVQLKIQYGPDVQQVDTTIGGTPKRLIVPKDILALDYTYTIAGSGGPLDAATRTQEMQSLYALLMRNPLVMNNPVRVWALTRMLLETYNRADILELIGTRDEAEQQAKASAMLSQLGVGGGQPGQGGGQPEPSAKPFEGSV